MRTSFLSFALLAVFSLGALAPAQRVIGWGDNRPGHLNSPAGVNDIVQFSTNGYLTLAVHRDGHVSWWGRKDSSVSAVVPPGLSGVAAVGIHHSGTWYESYMILMRDGTVRIWNYKENVYEAVPDGLSNVVKIKGGTCALALTASGRVVAWGGENLHSELDVPEDLVAIDIDSWNGACFAVRADGTLVSWGNISATSELQPPAGLTNVSKIRVDDLHALALLDSGIVVSWGQEWDDITHPPAGLKDVVQISTSGAQDLAVKADGSLVAWGSKEFVDFLPIPTGLGCVLQATTSNHATMVLIAPSMVTIDRLSIYAGESAMGTARIPLPAGSGGQIVTLASTDPAISVPATVRIPAGKTSATFPISSTLFFGTDRSVDITGSVDGAGGSPGKVRALAQTASLSLNTASYVGGSSTKPQVTVTLGWPSWLDTVLSLGTSDPALKVPATIRIPAGQKTAKVDVTHTLVPSDRNVSIEAKHDGKTVASASASVRALTGRVEMAASRVSAGSLVSGLVKLDSISQTATTVSLFSDYSGLTVPSSVTVPAGAREASFSASAKETVGNKTVRVSAKIGGNLVSTAIKTVAKAEIVAVELPSYFVGCSRTTGKVRLKAVAPEGGLLVNLVSSDPSVKVPDKVTVPEGSYVGEFNPTSSDIANSVSVTVTASVGASSQSDTIQVQPLTVSSLSMPSSVKGGSSMTATVTLTAAVSVSRSVAISCSDRTLITVPASVNVPAGARSVSFTIVTKSTTSQKTLTVSARKNESNVAKTLKINP
ncbi:hypothetical protein EON79_06490 [bacterium]|nr:MAG: hypothetical protein EON79_06490 [bacterium]